MPQAIPPSVVPADRDRQAPRLYVVPDDARFFSAPTQAHRRLSREDERRLAHAAELLGFGSPASLPRRALSWSVSAPRRSSGIASNSIVTLPARAYRGSNEPDHQVAARRVQLEIAAEVVENEEIPSAEGR